MVDDQRGSPTYVGHLAEATRELLELPYGTYHVAADGDCTWAEFAEAIFEEAGLDCRVRRITTAELGRPAPRPANSVLRSERGAPRAPALARRPSSLPSPSLRPCPGVRRQDMSAGRAFLPAPGRCGLSLSGRG